MATDLELDPAAGAPEAGGPRRERRRQQRRPNIVLLGMVALLLGFVASAWATGALAYGVWWLTNAEPPTVNLVGPPATVRGPAQVGVQVSPRARVVRAQVDDRPLAVVGENAPLTIDTTTLADGRHRVTVEAEDASFRKNRAEASFELRSDNTPPRLTVDSQPATVGEGRTWLLRVQTDEPASVEATLDGRPLSLQAGDGFGWVILGIGADDPPRDLPLALNGTDIVGNRAEQQGTMRVVKTEYTQDRIQVGPALMPLLDPQVRAAEDARLAPTYAQVSPTRLWDGLFRMPAQGEIVTQYGEVRSYNGGPFEGHHTGVDIAVPMGRAVLAPARGRVALIDQVRLRGNIVVLDHGLGVFTTYAHLSAVDVQVGQEVQAGQAFAKVGSTGLSEGPHLHWELWVRGVNVDPLEWTTRSFP